MTPPNINSTKFIPHLPTFVPTMLTVTNPKTTILIVPPAFDPVVLQNSTRMVPPTRHRMHPPSTTKIHKRQRIPHPYRLMPSMLPVTQTKLPVQVLP
eukprot:CAMPEP_0173432780 /NCGR_PEP_ID=MMETSP1357-20121228/10462_1 /TAXON_ID=77926 /ORGANISM="Hemiselmis rufescens, Strain PCC563" /LENGTH=96 /DNA_ID=CAMNT_0014397425 /DNA_START=125 /DNA_END=412 /DNA_ORIENTATION=-